MSDGDVERDDEATENGSAAGDQSAREVPLVGGNVTPVSRRGGTVLRSAGPWTPSVQAVLAHARDTGLTRTPEPRGLSPDGRELVSYLPGTVPAYPMPAWVWRDSVLVQAARMLRAWHDATDGFSPDDAVWRLPCHEPFEVICHNDFAQYNLVFDLDGGEPVLTGVIDFDTMSPGPRLWDIAYLAYRLVPYLDEPDAPEPHTRAARLALLLDAYGTAIAPSEVFAAMEAKLHELADFTQELAAASGRSDLGRDAEMYRDHAARITCDGA